MSQWYFHTPGQADRIGPLDDDAARRHAQMHRNALAWREGMQGWQPATALPELGGQAAPPPMPHCRRSGRGWRRASGWCISS